MKDEKINLFNLEANGKYEFYNLFQNVIDSYCLLISSIKYNNFFMTNIISINGKTNQKIPDRIHKNGRILLEICSTNYFSSLRNLLAMIMNIILNESNKKKWNKEVLPFIYEKNSYKKINSRTLNYIMEKTSFLKFCFTFNINQDNNTTYSFYNFMSWFVHKLCCRCNI